MTKENKPSKTDWGNLRPDGTRYRSLRERGPKDPPGTGAKRDPKGRQERLTKGINPEGTNYVWSTTHKQKCVLCGGPIWAGDLVMTFDNGVIHLKKKTCDEFRQGEKDPRDRPPRNRGAKVKKAGSGKA